MDAPRRLSIRRGDEAGPGAAVTALVTLVRTYLTLVLAIFAGFGLIAAAYFGMRAVGWLH